VLIAKLLMEVEPFQLAYIGTDKQFEH